MQYDENDDHLAGGCNVNMNSNLLSWCYSLFHKRSQLTFCTEENNSSGLRVEYKQIKFPSNKDIVTKNNDNIPRT